MFTSLNTGALNFSTSFEESLNFAQISNIEGLDLPLEVLLPLAEQTSEETIKDYFQTRGIRPGGWMLPVNFRGSEKDYYAGLETLPHYAALAQSLGSPWCATWILPFSDELKYADNMSFHIKRLQPIAQILSDNGCRFGLEFVGPKTFRSTHRYSFIHTLEEALEIGDKLQTNNCGLLLDCWHWYTSHANIADIAKLTAEQVVYVHVNDAPPDIDIDEQIDDRRLLPGASGVIDIVSFLQTLDRIGYDGPVVVEPFNVEVNAMTPVNRVQAAGNSLTRIWALAGLNNQKKKA